jgi:hypothetical protein
MDFDLTVAMKLIASIADLEFNVGPELLWNMGTRNIPRVFSSSFYFFKSKNMERHLKKSSLLPTVFE